MSENDLHGYLREQKKTSLDLITKLVFEALPKGEEDGLKQSKERMLLRKILQEHSIRETDQNELGE